MIVDLGVARRVCENAQYYYSTLSFKSQMQNSRKGLKIQNAHLNLDFRTLSNLPSTGASLDHDGSHRVADNLIATAI